MSRGSIVFCFFLFCRSDGSRDGPMMLLDCSRDFRRSYRPSKVEIAACA
jgi:hypothetical protein